MKFKTNHYLIAILALVAISTYLIAKEKYDEAEASKSHADNKVKQLNAA